MDFSVTRKLIDTLPEWIEQLAGALPAPTKVPAKPSGLQWDHPIHNAEVVQVAKAVRMASGIAAALRLADLGFTGECAILLRTVSDFASEVIFLAEGLLEGRMVAAQSKFVEDHFKPFPSSPNELAEREREYYVSRKEIQAAHVRLHDKTTRGSSMELTRLSAWLKRIRRLRSWFLFYGDGALLWEDAPLHADGARIGSP